MENLTHEQVANFAYWLIETKDHRGTKELVGKNRVSAIETQIRIFMSKYPNGILTGWNQGVDSFFAKYNVQTDLGVVYLQRNLTPTQFEHDDVRKWLRATNHYNDKVDFTNIQMEYLTERVNVVFKSVHVSVRTAADVPYTKIVFKEA